MPTLLMPIIIDVPLLFDIERTTPTKPAEKTVEEPSVSKKDQSFKQVLKQNLRETESTDPAAENIPLELLLPVVQAPAITIINPSPPPLVKGELTIEAQPVQYIEQIQAVQQQLQQAIQHNGRIQVAINPHTSMLLQFNHQRVSATYTSSELSTVHQLQHQVNQLKQANRTEQWPIETVTVNYEKRGYKQKKRQS